MELTKAFLQAILGNISEGVVVVDPQGKIVMANEAAARFAQPDPSAAPEDWANRYGVFYPDQETPFPAKELPLYRALKEQVRTDGVELFLRNEANPTGIFMSASGRPIHDRQGDFCGATVVMHDTTMQKKTEDELTRKALLDDLTGVRNRRGFLMLMDHHLQLFRRSRSHLGLLFIDVDGLKAVNDTHGHATGDTLLRETAQLLTRVFRASDVVGRMGGDEFCVLLSGNPPMSGPVATKRLDEAVDLFNAESERQWRLSLSMGVKTCTPDQQCSAEQMIQCADQAMYESRRVRLGQNSPTLK